MRERAEDAPFVVKMCQSLCEERLIQSPTHTTALEEGQGPLLPPPEFDGRHVWAYAESRGPRKDARRRFPAQRSGFSLCQDVSGAAGGSQCPSTFLDRFTVATRTNR